MKKAGILVGMFVIAFAVGRLYAITTNPASNVTADSDSSAFTIPYRDSNGAFSATITSKTIAQLLAITPSVKGQVYMCSDCANFLGATGEMVVSTGVTVGAWASAGGGEFK